MRKIITAAVLAAFCGGQSFAATIDPFNAIYDLTAAAPDAGSDTDTSQVRKAQVPVVRPIEWVLIPGGKFAMRNPDDETEPVRNVSVKTFRISKTHITVQQYAECVKSGKCSRPGIEYGCNWGVPGREHHPVNCVSWDQAVKYAKFQNARLPSEAQWEYAARGAGKDQKYPWGDQPATCDRAQMNEKGEDVTGFGCGTGTTMPVCSKPLGNTAQGLCDMSGNVWQWVQDTYQTSYEDTPFDGTAFVEPGNNRGSKVMRGGSLYNDAGTLRSDSRGCEEPQAQFDGTGFRIAGTAD